MRFLLAADSSLRVLPFFSTFPEIYKKDEACFMGMLELLCALVPLMGCFGDERDVVKFHGGLRTCERFKSAKTKQLLRKYSELLVIADKIHLVTFGYMLEHV
jgi:hypothetical protein